MKKVTFDPAKDLTLYFRCNRAGSKNFIFTYTDGTAYSFVYDELELHIYKNQGAKKKVISLTHIQGITLNSNTVTVAITKDQSNITEGEYYWELYRKDLEKTWLCGDAIFHNGKFNGVDESTETITIDIDGDDINITVQDTINIAAVPALTDFNASAAVFPAGALKGAEYQIIVEGILAGEFVPVGAIIRARQNAPSSDWTITGWKLT